MNMTLAAALNLALDEALMADDRVIVMGEDVGRTGGVFRVTDGLRAKHGTDRVVDTPVAESGIAGVALGLAVAGMRPVIEMQFMGFSYPALDQVINHVSRIRNRSRHRFSAPMVIRIPFGGGIGAAEHHSDSAEAMYVHTPGLKVVVPSRPSDAYALLRAAIEDPDPVVVLEPIRLYRSVKEDLPPEPDPVAIGEASVERSGDDLSIISYGAMMREARLAAEHLADSGVSVDLIDLRTLSPLDTKTILDSVRRTTRAILVSEAPRTAGVMSEVSALISERALYSLTAPVQRITGWDTVFPLKRSEHLFLPSTDRIVEAARRALGESL